MSQCHLLNPDPEEQFGDPDYTLANQLAEDSDQLANISDQVEAEVDDSWFTAETADNEIRLSDEGRMNIERIVGNLNLSMFLRN